MTKGSKTKTLFAANLSRLRKGRKLSQKRLSEIAGLTHNFINDIETAKKGVSFETIDRLSEALQVEPMHFFADSNYLHKHEMEDLLTALERLNVSINRVFDSYKNATIEESSP